ncbi:hypothetical protein EG329_005668 [Mollisiaceae sp. DMI_Dod_QoI]|nr:hypothetical protein EG329_005668 [Helotiales sp. DMI_Dod_QoI]
MTTASFVLSPSSSASQSPPENNPLAKRVRSIGPYAQKPGSGSRDVQDRIDHLEKLVLSLASNGSVKSSVVPTASQGPDLRMPDTPSSGVLAQVTDRSDVKETVKSLGHISLEDNHPSYVGSAHWASVLDSIADLKDSLENSERLDVFDESSTRPGPNLLVGGVRKATRVEILASLPSKPITDQLLDQFVDSMDMTSVIVHVPSFRREYENFWANPNSTPIMWIGLLYAILSLSIHFEQVSEKKTTTMNAMSNHALRDPEEVIKMFHEKTVQCLILGDYTEPVAYTVECLVLYFSLEHFRSADAQFGIWLVFGIIVKTAMKLGYHRDASQFSNVSIFRGEMQRRLWATIAHLDIHTSCQVGLPRMIKEGISDTQPPRHLLDEDFDEDTVVLPPSRPLSEITWIGYTLFKHQITSVFGMIVDQANSTLPISYDEVMRLDRILQDVNHETPEWLNVRSAEDLTNGDPAFMLQRLTIDLCYQKARCILHRKFLNPKSSKSYSIGSCVNASMRMLRSQAVMYRETKPGGCFYNQRWKAAALITNDFFLAAMLLCLILGHGLNSSKSSYPDTSQIMWSNQDMLQALENSYQIWKEASHKSKDAFKATKALKAVLLKIKAALVLPTARKSELTKTPMPGNTCFGFTGSYSSQTSTSTSTLPSQAEPIPPGDVSFSSNSPSDNLQSSSDAMETMIDPLNFNWDVWDGYFQNNGVDNTPPDLWRFDNSFGLPPANYSDLQ